MPGRPVKSRVYRASWEVGTKPGGTGQWRAGKQAKAGQADTRGVRPRGPKPCLYRRRSTRAQHPRTLHSLGPASTDAPPAQEYLERQLIHHQVQDGGGHLGGQHHAPRLAVLQAGQPQALLAISSPAHCQRATIRRQAAPGATPRGDPRWWPFTAGSAWLLPCLCARPRAAVLAGVNAHPSRHSLSPGPYTGQGRPTLATTLLSGRLQPKRNLVDQPPKSGYRGCRLTVTRSASCRVSASTCAGSREAAGWVRSAGGNAGAVAAEEAALPLYGLQTWQHCRRAVNCLPLPRWTGLLILPPLQPAPPSTQLPPRTRLPPTKQCSPEEEMLPMASR